MPLLSLEKDSDMNQPIFSREHPHSRTSYVSLNTRKCTACWKCLKSCPSHVIGKINLPWHKHALIVNPDSCIGCLKCIKACECGAYSAIDQTGQKIGKQNPKMFRSFIINNLLLLSGVVMMLSGLILQLGFHLGGNRVGHAGVHHQYNVDMQYEQIKSIDTAKTVWGFHYSDWSATHKVSIVLFLLLIVYHTAIHWSWYKNVFLKKIGSNNRLAITLSIVFLIVAVTGLVPWIVDLTGGTSLLRMLFIEIHDKVSLILIICLLLHVIRRKNWFRSVYERLWP